MSFRLQVRSPTLYAIAISALAPIYQDRGNLDKAEHLYCQAVIKFETLSNLAAVAAIYSDLSRIYTTRGKIEESQTLLRRGLAISTKP